MSYYHLKCKGFLFAINPDYKLNCSDFRFIFKNLKDSSLKGRKTLKEFRFFSKNYLLREYWHGGVLRNVFKNKYWEKKSRAFAELNLMLALRKKGFKVPEPLFAGKSGGNLYSQFIAIEKIENAKDLQEVELDGEIVEKVIAESEKLFDGGLYHPDFNIKNILLKDGEIYFIDFDKAVIFPRALNQSERYKIYRRMFRSFHKTGKIGVFSGFDFDKFPSYVKKAYDDYVKISSFRSFLWIFNKK